VLTTLDNYIFISGDITKYLSSTFPSPLHLDFNFR